MLIRTTLLAGLFMITCITAVHADSVRVNDAGIIFPDNSVQKIAWPGGANFLLDTNGNDALYPLGSVAIGSSIPRCIRDTRPSVHYERIYCRRV